MPFHSHFEYIKFVGFTARAKQGLSTAKTNMVFNEGVHYWEIKIDKFVGELYLLKNSGNCLVESYYWKIFGLILNSICSDIGVHYLLVTDILFSANYIY